MRGVVGVNKGLVAKGSVSHVTVHATVLGECLHIAVEFANLFDQSAQNFYKSVAATVVEPQFKVAVAWQQVLKRTTAALQVMSTENGELHFLPIEQEYWNIEGPKIGSRRIAYENYSMGCEEYLNHTAITTPLSDFLPKLSILT